MEPKRRGGNVSLFLVAELQNSAHRFKYVHKPNPNQLYMSVLDVPYCPKAFLLLHWDVRGRPALGALCTAFHCTRRLGTARFPCQLPARCEVPVPAPRQLSSPLGCSPQAARGAGIQARSFPATSSIKIPQTLPFLPEGGQ